jgi:ABC-2 type transport system ATP-binding protein
MVGLKAVANRPVGTFSKGMARRIGLAQALINDPDLLILDEPTTGLDPIGTRQIKDLILKLAQRGKTILLCSHLLADVEDVCDRISILYGGRIQIEGRVKDLLQQTNKRQITMDALSEDTLDKIRQMIQSQGSECEITSPIDRLETFFIRTVATAQQKEHPTSGAVSTTKIGDFLTQERPVENILDELVSSPESKDISSEVIQTEKVVTSGSSASVSEPDERMLNNLTQQAEPEQVVDTEEVRTEPVDSQNQEPQQGQIKKNILDQLVDNSDSQNKDFGESEKPQAGESGDA